MIPTEPQYDVIIVGAGFGGCYLLNKLREEGFKVLVLDDGKDLGGVWYWNCYAGARTDSMVPLYEFSNKDIWSDWTWNVKYPSQRDLRDYFAHVESKLHLKKDIRFNSRVLSSEFDSTTAKWQIKTKDGAEFTSRNLILCLGFASKPNIPKFKGLETFAGTYCHTARWPQEDIDFRGKRVGVVGNGSSGLQVIQTIAPVVKHLTVFQRSPTYALPMRQGPLTEEQLEKANYDKIFAKRPTTFTGLDCDFNPKSALDDTDEERQRFFEGIWAKGGLSFWLGTYYDVIMNKESNRHAYEFWRSKVLPRIKDPKKAELLAPEDPPYFFGTKRATLEQRYYEVYNQDNVELVNAKENPIKEVVPSGIITQDDVLHEFDILILATGFDSVTGGIMNIDIKGVDGQSLQQKWAKGATTALGMTTTGFPNLFFVYGPQAPTSFSNGPTSSEVQGDWIVETLDYLRKKGYTWFNPGIESEKAWSNHVEAVGAATLLPYTKSEYMGTNVPGKPKQMLNYLGGLPKYIAQVNEIREKGFPGYEVR
ncbi:MAG: hypothetical protein M1819_007268 [Sarea resinae]|nr:MAG: hypothetical protein M1819_007268 [Sarea resinae]